jgi:hypothetical protein
LNLPFTDRDTAFGIFVRALPETREYETLRELSSGLELADSIAGDAHKLLNVVSAYPVWLSNIPFVAN